MNSFVQRLSRISANENSNLNKWLVQILHAFKYLVSTNQIKKLNKYVINSVNILTTNQIKTGIAGSFYPICSRATCCFVNYINNLLSINLTKSTFGTYFSLNSFILQSPKFNTSSSKCISSNISNDR